jgi:uncharacterized RDD family membrane protein YckC
MIGAVLKNLYEITDEIARGDTTVTYCAVNRTASYAVAVKAVYPEVAASIPDFANIFLSTARECGHTAHENLNPIIETGLEHGILFVIVNFVQGDTLREYIRKRGRLSLEETALILNGVAGAVGAIHARGYVHHNIHSNNVMIWQGTLRPTLMDFGIVKPEFLAPPPLDALAHREYVCPELLRGGIYTTASDIYSLGLLTYEMLTGRMPFEPGAARATDPPAPLSALAPDVPPEAENAIMRALATDPQYRFATAGEFAQALSRDVMPHLSQAPAQPKLRSPAVPMAPATAVPFFDTTPTAEPLAAPQKAVCANHPESEAAAFCITCGKALCPACERPVDGRPFCPQCFSTQRRRRLTSRLQKIAPPETVEKWRAALSKRLFNKELRRLCALLIDTILVLMLAVPLMLIILLVSMPLMREVHGLTAKVSYYLSLLFTATVYYIGAHYRWGRTLGKFLFGLVVTHTDGKPLTFLGAFWRWIGFLTALIWAFIGWGIALWALGILNLARQSSMGGGMNTGAYFLVKAGAVMLAVITSLGVGITFVGKHKRGFHDILAGSIVKFEEEMERRIRSVEGKARKVPGPDVRA